MALVYLIAFLGASVGWIVMSWLSSLAIQKKSFTTWMKVWGIVFGLLFVFFCIAVAGGGC